MIGRLFIDGEDAYVTYGVAVCQGGYDRLVEFPKPKPYTKNDWHESNGLEIDNSPMVFQAREVPINFVCFGTQDKFSAFIDSLADGVDHTFNFFPISLTCTLRYINTTNFVQCRGFSTFTATFGIDGDVFAGYTYSEPSISAYGDTSNQFNFGHFRQFGLSILGNYRSELFKATNAKKSLSYSLAGTNGIVYDTTGDITFAQRTSKLNFIMQSDSWSDLWERWKALLYNFANNPGKWHDLYLNDLPLYSIDVCYESMNVEQLMSNSKRVVVKFSINVLVNIKEMDYEPTALITESGKIVSTDDGYLVEVVEETV